MPLEGLPLTYGELRARFRRAARRAGLSAEAHPIDARGPHGEELTIDVATVGRPGAPNVLIVLSGVHGVEAPIASALQCDLLERLDDDLRPDDVRVVLVHGVNPWGMAFWRRANEHNVDLNRNWNRDGIDPPGNPAYEAIHHLMCPETTEEPTLEGFADPMRALIAEHGGTWMRDAVGFGQYTHPRGFHFGGDRTEQSTRILADVVAAHADGATRSLCVDLHTGHGDAGTHTLLTGARLGSHNDRWIRDRFRAERCSGRAKDAPERHRGHLGAGLAEVLPGSEHHSVILEFGTRTDERQGVAARLEHWLHHHGDRTGMRGAEIIAANRRGYTPDEPEWARTALHQGRAVLDRALGAFGTTPPGQG